MCVYWFAVVAQRWCCAKDRRWVVHCDWLFSGSRTHCCVFSLQYL